MGETLVGAYDAILKALEGYPPRVQAMALTAVLAEVVASAFKGNDDEIFASLRMMIQKAREQMPT